VRSGYPGASGGLTVDGMGAVVLGEKQVTVEDVCAVARGVTVEIDRSGWDRITAGRAVLDAALAEGRPVYGVNRGVGHGKDVRLDDAEVRRVQRTLLETHSGGLGPAAPADVVRAAMLVRLAGMACGGSGASVAAVEVLLAMVNAGVHPVVPLDGSVGAGDLGQMAYVGLVAIGLGEAEYDGAVLPGAEALRRAGIAPLELRPKDGLTLMSSNGMSVGRGALVVERAARLAGLADVVAALSLEATEGNPEAMRPVVGAAKPYDGQIAACDSLTEALAGSYLLEPDGPRSIQDPLSFRVVPQVHGAFRELVGFVRRAVEVELNSMSDNPLVSVEDGSLVHNGNFHPMVLACAFDALRPAIAHVGLLSDRRMSHLWDAFFARGAGPVAGGLPDGDRLPAFDGLALRYPAAARLAELKQLAGPATLDIPVLDMGQEDHATGAPLTVARTAAALDLLETLLTVEVLLARDVLGVTRPAPVLGAGTGAMLAAVDAELARPGTPRTPSAVHEVVREVLRGTAR
jgi:histidine ammonia-lyase